MYECGCVTGRSRLIAADVTGGPAMGARAAPAPSERSVPLGRLDELSGITQQSAGVTFLIL